jgi:sugar lactone lactonase YvrE
VTRDATVSASPLRIWSGGGFELAEGTRWLGDRLVYTDIGAGTVRPAPGAAPGDSEVLARLGVPLGAVAPIAGRPGEWIAAAGTGIARIGSDGTLTWIGRPEDESGAAMRMNDGCCDPLGRFWAGSMAYDAVEGAGSLYRVGADAAVVKVLDGMTIVNGPAFTADGALMYVTDTFAGLIYACPVDPPTGEITGRRVFAEIPPSDGAPDGMTVDSYGRLWVALWDGFAVRCYRPDGSVEATIPVPAQRPTSVCLGGPGGGRLFVSTARYGIGVPSPEDGAILSAVVGASAPAAASFSGSAGGSLDGSSGGAAR